MQEESPLEYYVRRAGEFGISKELLFPERYLEVTVPLGVRYREWDRSDLDGHRTIGGMDANFTEPSQLFSRYSITSSSAKNNNGIWIRSSQCLDLDFEMGSEIGVRHPVSREECGFWIFGLSAIYKNANALIIINDSKIKHAQSGFGTKMIPEDLFEIGKDYHPALDWMLQQYNPCLKL